MSGLEQAFYILGIVFMALSLGLVLSLVIAVIVIRNKIVNLEKMIEDKLHMATNLPSKVVEVATALRELQKKVGK